VTNAISENTRRATRVTRLKANGFMESLYFTTLNEHFNSTSTGLEH
jgi:hypothetical protein